MAIDDSSEMHLAQWFIVEVPHGLELKRHMFGEKRGGGWRISSPIVEETSGWARTLSGSLYHKDGIHMATLSEEAVIALAYFLGDWGFDRQSLIGIITLSLAQSEQGGN